MASDDNCAAHDGRPHLPHMSIGIPKGSQIKTAVQERNDHNGRQRNPTALVLSNGMMCSQGTSFDVRNA